MSCVVAFSCLLDTPWSNVFMTCHDDIQRHAFCVTRHIRKKCLGYPLCDMSCHNIIGIAKCDVTRKLNSTMFNQKSFALMCTMKKVHQMPCEAKSVKTWAIPLSQKLPSAMSTVGKTDPYHFAQHTDELFGLSWDMIIIHCGILQLGLKHKACLKCPRCPHLGQMDKISTWLYSSANLPSC